MSARFKPSVTIGQTHSAFNHTVSLALDDHDRGFLVNRLTTAERDAILSPPTGLLIYNTDVAKFQYWDNNEWLSHTTDPIDGSSVITGTINSSSVIIGTSSGSSNTGTNVTALGTFAADNNTAMDLIAIGWGAGGNNTGDLSIFLGHDTGIGNSASAIGIGENAAQGNAQYGLVAVGSNSGVDNGGIGTIAIGMTAGFEATSGDYGIFIGVEAGRSNTGAGVIAIGQQAAKNNTTDHMLNIGDELVGVMGNNDSTNPPTFTNDLKIAGNLRLATHPPASATAPGKAGTIAWEDNGYFYVCIADNTWVRTLLATW